MADRLTGQSRMLYFISIFSGFLAVIYWLMLQKRIISFYPGDLHIALMSFGFLWAFWIGVTLNRLAESHHDWVSKNSKHIITGSVAAFLVFLQIVFGIRNMMFSSLVVATVQSVFLLILTFLRLRLATSFEKPLLVKFALWEALLAGVIVILLVFAILEQVDYRMAAGLSTYIFTLLWSPGFFFVCAPDRYKNKLALVSFLGALAGIFLLIDQNRFLSHALAMAVFGLVYSVELGRFAWIFQKKKTFQMISASAIVFIFIASICRVFAKNQVLGNAHSLSAIFYFMWLGTLLWIFSTSKEKN